MASSNREAEDREWQAAMLAVPFSGRHTDCAQHLRQVMAAGGVEVTVRAANPLIPTPWTQGMTCPHGTTFWYEPTSDQRATWNREQTP